MHTSNEIFGINEFLNLYLNLYNLCNPGTGGQTIFFGKNKIILLISACHLILLGGYLENSPMPPPPIWKGI